MSFKGRPFRFQRKYGTYVMENVLFKISFPAEFHAQTAAEAAMTLHRAIAKAGKTVDDIEQITIRTHAAAIRIIDKQGPLNNPADRDHCIQYMVAVPLIFGRLTAGDYEDTVARDPRIDALRKKIVCVEDPQFTKDYHDPEKRSIANGITVRFKGKTAPNEGRSRRSWWSTRSATGGGARKAYRCCSRSSGPTWPAAFRPGSRTPSCALRWTRKRSRPCRSTSMSICT